ncbi:GTPase Der [Paenibacillus sp. P1XP2]|nr:GTPase Der [Paenibacillus sp. P1XP2]
MANVTKSQLYENHINVFLKRFPAFEFLRDSFVVPNNTNTWTFQGRERNDVQVLFIGKTGYGKSTAMNTLIGESLFESSDVSACTRTSQCADFYLNDNKDAYLSFGDLPGIGESAERDKEYLELYNDFLSLTSVVVYFLRADQRDYTVDLHSFQSLLRKSDLRDKVVIALNCADKVEPINRTKGFKPSYEQVKNIDQKCRVVSELFSISSEYVVPISASENWNMGLLMDKVANIINKDNDSIIVPPWHSSEWKDTVKRFGWNI